MLEVFMADQTLPLGQLNDPASSKASRSEPWSKREDARKQRVHAV